MEYDAFKTILKDVLALLAISFFILYFAWFVGILSTVKTDGETAALTPEYFVNEAAQ